MYFNQRLFAFTAGFRWNLLFSLFFGLLTASAGISRLAFSGYAISLVLLGRPMNDVWVAIGAVVVSIILRASFQYLKEMTGHRAAANIQINMRRSLYEKALTLGPGALDQKRAGDLLISLVEGVDQLETYFGEYLPQMGVAALTPIGVFIFMAFLDLQTAGIYLGFALFTLVAPFGFHKWNVASSSKRRKVYGDLSAEFLDAVQGLPTLKAFGQSKARGEILADKARAVYKSTMGVLAMNTGTTGVTWFGITGGAATALAFGAIRVNEGSLELAPLLIIVMLGVEVFRPLRELTSLYHKGMLGLSAATAVFDLVDSKPIVEDINQISESSMILDPTLEFRNVTFSYPGGRGTALEDISFELNRGETLGVVGRSGAGKSTLIWMALRFFDPGAGRILLGGHDLHTLPLATVRRNMAVVTQDTYLFHGTVSENLRLGNPEADQATLEEAAHVANAHGFISELPEGYETIIGERGIRLSGGQRQRIAIARALLKDAPILLLDEALSSVDTESEHLIQQALNRLMVGRTTLVIAHRLSSVVNSKRIVVLDNGKIVEEGSHKTLLEHKNVYHELMSGQLDDASEIATADSIGESYLTPRPSNSVTQSEFVIPAQKPENVPPTHIPTASSSPMTWIDVFIRLLGLMKPWKGMLTATFVLGVLRIFVLIGVSVVSALIARDAASDQTNNISILILLLGIMAFLTPVLHWGESWISHDMAFRLLSEMRIAVYKKLDPLSPAYLVRRRSGDILGVVTSDIETIESFFAHTIAPAFVAVTVPAAVLITIGILQWPLALVLLPFLIFVGVTPFIANKALDRVASASRDQLGEINAHMVDSVQGMREIVAFSQENERLLQISENQREFARHRIDFFRHLTLQRVSIETCIGLAGISVLGVGAYFVSLERLESGLLPLLSLVALSSFVPVSEVAQVGKQLADTLASSRRVFSIHDEPITVRDGNGVSVEKSISSSRFKEVTFAYPLSQTNALQDLEFSIDAGETVALVGRSGAGKSTAAHLLLRFWDPTTGKITVGNHNISDFRLDDLRNSIALVAQDTYLFNTTIRENLKIANPNASDSEIISAAKEANADEFISVMPDGYDTTVGERGVQLSGGQRQRIAIARAVLKNSTILVLDEATSHLDTVNEQLVRGALARLMQGRTTLVIAHRLSTVRNANKIVVLDQGHLVEEGTHDELMTLNGLYAHLVSAQLTHRTS